MPIQRKIIVSGSSGLVGSRLVAALRSRDYEVKRLVRKSEALQPDELQWNPEVGLAEPQALNGIDAVVHLAGRNIASARWTQAEKKRIYDSRVVATTQLVKQMLTVEQPPSIFIGASAVGIYGDCGDQIVDENHPIGSDFLAGLARNWEASSLPLTEAGVRVAHARLGIVLDRNEGALAKMLPLFRWGLGGRLGNGRQYWSWIAIEDVIEGLCWLLENPNARGPYNFVSPEPVTNKEFTATLANAIGRPALIPVPKFALHLALGEMAELLLTSCRAVPKELEAAAFQFRSPSLSNYLHKVL